MATTARAIRQIRVTLSAATLTAIVPPQAATQCIVANGTAADVELHTADDSTEYRVIPSGYERAVRAFQLHGFRHDETAFWLKSTPGGLVILEWT
jgi:hypothetical protein